MGAFVQQAEDILNTAAEGDSDQDIVIAIDRQGGMRLLESAGWTLPAVAAEFGATAVFHVERRSGTVRVEGLSGAERCLLQRRNRPDLWRSGLPGLPTFSSLPAHAMMLQTSALALG